MFNLFRKTQQKDPICGMYVDENFISKYRKRFCSEHCMKEYEVQNHIAGSEYGSSEGGCCG